MAATVNLKDLDLYPVNSTPSQEKLKKYDDDRNAFYRYQCKEWEMGTESWGMIYSTGEEAIEDGSTVLNGKSCCSTAREARHYRDEFDTDFRVLVVRGDDIESGHDGESVVDIEEILEIWDYDEFLKQADEWFYANQRY